MSKNIAIVLSGGVGSRMGSDRPKQYLEIEGKPIIAHAVQTFAAHPRIDALVIAVAPEWEDYVRDLFAVASTPIYYAPAGETRQYSIFNALEAAERAGYGGDDIVIVHDAARPFVSRELIDRCIDAVAEGYDGALPVLPVKDTIYQSADGVSIGNLLPRAQLFAGQAPESFRLVPYLQLHRQTPREELLLINGSTELAYIARWNVKLIEGDERNFKITTPEDITRMVQTLHHLVS